MTNGVAEGSDLRRRLGQIELKQKQLQPFLWQREAISVGDLDVSASRVGFESVDAVAEGSDLRRRLGQGPFEQIRLT